MGGLAGLGAGRSYVHLGISWCLCGVCERRDLGELGVMEQEFGMGETVHG
jgi:hypothetical protein